LKNGLILFQTVQKNLCKAMQIAHIDTSDEQRF
jgi:hypothetical protein